MHIFTTPWHSPGKRQMYTLKAAEGEQLIALFTDIPVGARLTQNGDGTFVAVDLADGTGARVDENGIVRRVYKDMDGRAPGSG